MKKLTVLLTTLVLALSFAGCSAGKNDKVITVGASPSPHGEILEFIKPQLEKEGYTLEIKIFTDYKLPNVALSAGELDANFFQHQPYLTDYNEKNKTDIVSAALVHFEPLGIYPGKCASLADLKDGAVIGVPNDSTNEARALQLLEANGIIKLDPKAGLSATPKDITENPKNVKISELEAVAVAINIQDLDFGIVNGNYAIEKGIADTVLVFEDSQSAIADQYTNILAVLPKNLDSAKTKALVKALHSDETKAFFKEKYGNHFAVKF